MATGIYTRDRTGAAAPAPAPAAGRSSGEKIPGRPNPPRKPCSCLRCRDIVFAVIEGGRLARLDRPSKSGRYRLRKRFAAEGIRLSGCQSFGRSARWLHGYTCPAWDLSAPLPVPASKPKPARKPGAKPPPKGSSR